MIKYVVKKNNNEASPCYGKYYAYPVVEETMDLEALAEHMEEHNSGFSGAMCLGIMTAMVKCIKEQLLAGKNVKIDNLAIFSCGIRNRQGAVSEEEFTVANNIAGVKLRARATGTLSNTNLNLAATLRKAATYVGKTSSTGTAGDDNSQTTPPTDNGETGGSDSAGGSQYE
ncbi:MAG: DNA-binding protein [Bacteroidales bacterium]|nr:DNA-binding protein [Bacteroidales bacterium]